MDVVRKEFSQEGKGGSREGREGKAPCWKIENFRNPMPRTA